MRKNLLVVSVLLLACVLALAGCSKAKALEKDVQVVLDVNGTIAGTVTVNSFNNAVISEPQAPANTVFRGWTVQSSWADDASDVKFIQNKGLVRYDDVKDAVKGDSRSVVLHAVFAAAPKKDLVIAWYSKESTSGLNQGHMDAFLAKLNAYLESVGKKGLDIGIRAYDGGVADTCAAIKKDGDVDIMVGWSSTGNLTGTGGWTEGSDFLENVGSITIGAKARYAARITDTDFVKQVYAWIQNEFGSGAAPAAAPAAAPSAEQSAPAPAPATETPAAAPAAAPAASEDNTIVIAWYAKEGTSGLNQSYMDAFEGKLKAWLSSQGIAAEVVIRGYEGNVGETCAAIKAAGDVDIMVGWAASSNLTGTGGLVEGTDFLENTGEITIGAKARYAARKNDAELTKKVYQWILGEFGPKTEEAPAAEPAPVAEAPAAAPAGDGKLVIGWYAKTGTSGMDEAMAEKLSKAVKAFLDANGLAVELVVRPYDGTVAEVQSAVLAAGDVDLMVGMKAFALEGIEMEVQNDIVMGPKTDRRFHRISSEDAAVKVFEWLRTEEARKLFVAE